MGQVATARQEEHRHLTELVQGFRTGMLVTHSEDGGLQSRPMAIAEAREDGDLYFATSIDSPKVHQTELDNHVVVTLQNDRSFVSVSGRARVIRDRALIERLWSESWRVWFPDGKDDPNLCILAVHADSGEYWDQTGAAGLKFAWEAAKAYVQGRTPQADREQHAKVPL